MSNGVNRAPESGPRHQRCLHERLAAAIAAAITATTAAAAIPCAAPPIEPGAGTTPPAPVSPAGDSAAAPAAERASPLPEARVVLDAACAWLGPKERLVAIESYRARLEGTQRFRALQSQQWIELPIDAEVVWMRSGTARIRVDETVVGPDGEDLRRTRVRGRVNDVAWESSSGSDPLRIPAISDPIGRADPLRIVYDDLPRHRERFGFAAAPVREKVGGRVALRIDLAADARSVALDEAGSGKMADGVRSIWIDEESSEVVAVRAHGSGAKTIFLAWSEVDGLRTPVELVSAPLFGSESVGIVAVELCFGCVGANEVAAPKVLHDPTSILPPDKQRTTDDS